MKPLVLPEWARRVLPVWIVQPLRRLFWRLPNLRRRLPSGLELIVESPADWTIYNDVFADGEYDEAIRACIDDASPSRALTVLDLGANVGYFVLRLADVALRRGVDTRFVAVEASPRLARDLELRLPPQAALADRVRIVHALAGRRKGAGRLFESAHHFENSAVPHDQRPSVSVPYVDLAALVAEWPRIDLLKCDVEGAELEVLETYAPDLLPRVHRAVVELHHGRCDTARCLELLRDAGFGPPRVLREAHGCSLVLVTRPEHAP